MLGKQKKKREIKKKIAKGEMLPTRRQIGQRRYEARAQEFKEMDEVDPVASRAGASLEPLREQFDGIYRRGLLEPERIHRKKNKWRMPKLTYVNMQDDSWTTQNKSKKGDFGIVN